MRWIHSILVVALLVQIVSMPCYSQGAVSIAPGTRVRVSAPSIFGTSIIGTVESVDRDTLKLSYPWPLTVPRIIPIASVTKLDVSIGDRRNTLKGAAVGVGCGVGLGIIFGVAAGDDEPGFMAFSAEDKAILAGSALGLGGLILGILIGSTTKTEHWRPVPLDRIRLSVKPRSDGALVFSASFAP